MNHSRAHTRVSYPRAVAGAAALIFLVACHGNVYKVATFQNNYDFRIARYNESCRISSPPAWCAAYYTDLLAAEKALKEANTALQHGGAMPLQLKAVKAADKALVR